MSVWKQHVLYRLIRKYLFRTIIFSLIIAGVSVGAGIFLKNSSYESATQLVQNDNNYSLINSYGQYLTSSDFKTRVNSEIQNSKWKNYSNKDNYKVSISTGTSTPFFSIKVTSMDVNYSIFLANHVTDIFTGNIGKYLSGANVSVVSHTKKATKISEKRGLTLIASVSFLISFIIIIMISFYAELFSGNVKGASYTENVLGIKKLGSIGMDQRRDNKGE